MMAKIIKAPSASRLLPDLKHPETCGCIICQAARVVERKEAVLARMSVGE